MSFLSKLFSKKDDTTKISVATAETIKTENDSYNSDRAVSTQEFTKSEMPIVSSPTNFAYPADKTFLFVDVETANSSNDTICAIGSIVVRDGKEYSLYSLINPKTHITNTAIHGISDADVVGAPTINDYWTEILKVTGEEFIVVGHNVPFDISVLHKDLNRYGIEFNSTRKVDTMAIAKDILYNFSTQSGDLKLDTLCRKLNICLDHHNAASDISATKQVLETLLDMGNRNIIEFINVHFSSAKECAVGNVRKIKAHKYWDDIEIGRTPVYFTNWHNVSIDEDPQYDEIDIDILQYCSMMDRSNCGIKRIHNQVELIKNCVETIGGKTYKKGAKSAKCYIEFYYMDVEEYQKLKTAGYRIYHAIDVENFIKENPNVIQDFIAKKAEEAALVLAEKEQLRIEREERRAQREAKKLEPKEPAKRKTRRVAQMNDEGKIINVFESLSSAVQTTGTNSKSIRDCCNGVQKHAGGYVWKYMDEE